MAIWTSLILTVTIASSKVTISSPNEVQQSSILLINPHFFKEDIQHITQMGNEERFVSVTELKMKIWLHYLWYKIHDILQVTTASCCNGSDTCF